MFVLFHHKGEKIICSSVRLRVFVTEDLDLYVIVLGKEGSSPHRCIDCMFDPEKWRYQDQLMGTKWNLAILKVMNEKSSVFPRLDFHRQEGLGQWQCGTVYQ